MNNIIGAKDFSLLSDSEFSYAQYNFLLKFKSPLRNYLLILLFKTFLIEENKQFLNFKILFNKYLVKMNYSPIKKTYFYDISGLMSDFINTENKTDGQFPILQVDFYDLLLSLSEFLDFKYSSDFIDVILTEKNKNAIRTALINIDPKIINFISHINEKFSTHLFIDLIWIMLSLYMYILNITDLNLLKEVNFIKTKIDNYFSNKLCPPY